MADKAFLYNVAPVPGCRADAEEAARNLTAAGDNDPDRQPG